MNLKAEILELFGSTEDILFADGLDDAIIGFEPNLWKVVYSRNKVINGLVKDGMSEDDAMEYADYNIFAAMVGDKTPIWVEDFNWT